MKKRFIILLLAVLMLAPQAGRARDTWISGVPVYSGRIETWTFDLSVGQEETLLSRTFMRVIYDENALASSLSILHTERTPTQLTIYGPGTAAETVDLTECEGAEGDDPAASEVSPFEYSLTYTFDALGNPDSVTIVPARGGGGRAWSFVNRYEDGKLVSVTAEPRFSSAENLPLYQLFGYFPGYADAFLDFGDTRCRNRDGKPAWEKSDLGITESVAEYEYAQGRLVRRTTATFVPPFSAGSLMEYRFDEAGRPNGLTEGECGEDLLLRSARIGAEMSWREAEDAEGGAVYEGVLSFEGEEIPEGIDPAGVSLRCRMHANGRAAEITLQYNGQTWIDTRYDENGNTLYQETQVEPLYHYIQEWIYR